MGNNLWEREPHEWTDEELSELLTKRYAPTDVPPCRICGAELSMQSIGGGRPTVWACDGREEDPTRPGTLRYVTGRSPADDHYSRSQFEDCRQGGDEAVVELQRRYAALRTVQRFDPHNPDAYCPTYCGGSNGCLDCAVGPLADAAAYLVKQCSFSEDPPHGTEKVREALDELKRKGWWSE